MLNLKTWYFSSSEHTRSSKNRVTIGTGVILAKKKKKKKKKNMVEPAKKLQQILLVASNIKTYYKAFSIKN